MGMEEAATISDILQGNLGTKSNLCSSESVEFLGNGST